MCAVDGPALNEKGQQKCCLYQIGPVAQFPAIRPRVSRFVVRVGSSLLKAHVHRWHKEQSKRLNPG
jgi:hypothetical protein